MPAKLVMRLTLGGGSAGVTSVVKAVSEPFPFVPLTVMVYVVAGDGTVKDASGPIPSVTTPSPSIDHTQFVMA